MSDNSKLPYYVNSNNLFSIILQTGLKNSTSTSLKDINADANKKTPQTQPQQVTLPDNGEITKNSAVNSIKTDSLKSKSVEMSYANLFSNDQNAERLRLTRIAQAKRAADKQQKQNAVSMNDWTGSIGDIQYIENANLGYTLTDGIALYKNITGNDIDPNNLKIFSDSETIKFYKLDTEFKSDPFTKFQNKLIFKNTDTIDSKMVEIPVIMKLNCENWKSNRNDPDKIKANYNKIIGILSKHPDNIKYFDRILKIITYVLSRECGTPGISGRYGKNKALIQIELGIMCWCIFNAANNNYNKCEGSILKLLRDTNFTNNAVYRENNNQAALYIYGTDADNDKADLIADETKNMKSRILKDNNNTNFAGDDTNVTLFVLAFLNGYIHEELKGYTNWDHRTSIGGDVAKFKLRTFLMPSDNQKIFEIKTSVNESIKYPKFVNEGDGDFEDKIIKQGIALSRSQVYSLPDNVGINVIFSNNGSIKDSNDDFSRIFKEYIGDGETY